VHAQYAAAFKTKAGIDGRMGVRWPLHPEGGATLHGCTEALGRRRGKRLLRLGLVLRRAAFQALKTANLGADHFMNLPLPPS